MNEKQGLRNDFNEIVAKAHDLGCIVTSQDAFALGYMAAKQGLTRLINNDEKVIAAVAEYDKTNDLGLNDTIGEVLVELDVIGEDAE